MGFFFSKGSILVTFSLQKCLPYFWLRDGFFFSKGSILVTFSLQKCLPYFWLRDGGFFSKGSILVTFSLQKCLPYFWLRDGLFFSRTGAARGWWRICTAFCHVTLILAIMHFCLKIKWLLLLSFLFYIL